MLHSPAGGVSINGTPFLKCARHQAHRFLILYDEYAEHKHVSYYWQIYSGKEVLSGPQMPLPMRQKKKQHI